MKPNSYRAMILRLTQIHDQTDNLCTALASTIQSAPPNYSRVGPLDACLIDLREIQRRLRAVIDYLQPSARQEAASQ